MIAAASSTGIQVYDASTLVEKYWIERLYGVSAVAFSPDSTLIAVAENGLGIVLYSTQDGRSQIALEDSASGQSYALLFSPKQDIVASIDHNGLQTHLWNVADGTFRQTLKYGNAAAFSLDGKYLAVGSDEGFALLDVSNGESVYSVTFKTASKYHYSASPLLSIAYSPDGASVATLDEDGLLNLWNASDGKKIRLLKTINSYEPSTRTQLIFSRNGSLLAFDTGITNGKIGLLEVSEGRVLQEFPAGAYGLVAFSPIEDQLVTATQEYTIQVWDTITGKPIIGTEGGFGTIGHLAFSPDGKFLAASGGWFYSGSPLRLWQVSNGALTVLSKNGLKGFAFSPDGHKLVSDDLKTFQMPAGSPLAYTAEQGISLAFSPDGTILATGYGLNNTLEILNGRNMAYIQSLPEQAGTVISLAFSADSAYLATGSTDKMIRIWHMPDGKLLYTLKEHKKDVLSVAFSPTQNLLASAALDGTVRLWSADTGKLVRTIYGGAIYGLAFSPDGKLLVGGGSFSSIKVWRVDGGSLLHILTFANSGTEVRALAFSPDGTLLAVSPSSDHTVWLLGIPNP